MRKSIGKKELLEIIEEWKIKATQLIYRSNRSIDNNEIERLRAEANGIYICVNELSVALNSDISNVT